MKETITHILYILWISPAKTQAQILAFVLVLWIVASQLAASASSSFLMLVSDKPRVDARIEYSSSIEGSPSMMQEWKSWHDQILGRINDSGCLDGLKNFKDTYSCQIVYTIETGTLTANLKQSSGNENFDEIALKSIQMLNECDASTLQFPAGSGLTRLIEIVSISYQAPLMRKPVTVYPIKSNVKPDRAARKRASINSVGRLSGPLEFISFVEVPPVELISGNRKLLASSKWSGTALHPSWRKRVIAPLVDVDQEPKSDGYNPHDPLSLEEKVRDFFQSIHFQERSIEEDIANHLRSIYRRRRVPPIAPSSQRFLVIFSDNGGSLECVIQQNRVVPLVRPLEFRTTSSPIQGTTETSLTPSFSTMLNSRTDKSEQ